MSGSNRVTLSRRTLLTTAGTSALVLPAWPTRAGELAATPSQTEGPFYPPELPRDTDADLVRVTGADAQALGVVTHVTGRVLDARGWPLPGHLVEIWQCDAHGRYLAEHGSSWGDWFRTWEAPDPGFQGYVFR